MSLRWIAVLSQFIVISLSVSSGNTTLPSGLYLGCYVKLDGCDDVIKKLGHVGTSALCTKKCLESQIPLSALLKPTNDCLCLKNTSCPSVSDMKCINPPQCIGAALDGCAWAAYSAYDIPTVPGKIVLSQWTSTTLGVFNTNDQVTVSYNPVYQTTLFPDVDLTTTAYAYQPSPIDKVKVVRFPSGTQWISRFSRRVDIALVYAFQWGNNGQSRRQSFDLPFSIGSMNNESNATVVQNTDNTYAVVWEGVFNGILVFENVLTLTSFRDVTSADFKGYSLAISACAPTCSRRGSDCGADGCQGSCGNCPDGQTCNDGKCGFALGCYQLSDNCTFDSNFNQYYDAGYLGSPPQCYSFCQKNFPNAPDPTYGLLESQNSCLCLDPPVNTTNYTSTDLNCLPVSDTLCTSNTVCNDYSNCFFYAFSSFAPLAKGMLPSPGNNEPVSSWQISTIVLAIVLGLLVLLAFIYICRMQRSNHDVAPARPEGQAPKRGSVRVQREGNLSSQDFELKNLEVDRREGQEGVPNVPEGHYCVVCMAVESNHLITPCGHLCICGNCKNSLTDNKCPICRKSIDAIFQAYRT